MNLDNKKRLLKADEFKIIQEIVERSFDDLKSMNEFQCFIRNTIGNLIPYTIFFVSVEKFVFDSVCTEKFFVFDPNTGLIDDARFSNDTYREKIIKKWLVNKRPIEIDIKVNDDYSLYIEKYKMCKLEVGSSIVHGQIDISGRMAVMYGFVNLNLVNQRYKVLIEAVIPYIQQIFVNTMASISVSKKNIDLSSKQYEVLKWMMYGKTNKEIAKILNKSDFTVRNQVSAILGKLGANNRSEIMVRAEEAGLLSNWGA